jgi:hypothetical protein
MDIDPPKAASKTATQRAMKAKKAQRAEKKNKRRKVTNQITFASASRKKSRK